MQFDGEVAIETDSETTWELISDPEVLVMCVPGAEEVEQVNQAKYVGTIKRGVAGINISLDGELGMTELHPPTYLEADATGEDTNTGSRLDADAELRISENEDGTKLEYTIDMEFTGRLATLGARITKRKISKDIDTFFDNIKKQAEAVE